MSCYNKEQKFHFHFSPNPIYCYTALCNNVHMYCLVFVPSVMLRRWVPSITTLRLNRVKAYKNYI